MNLHITYKYEVLLSHDLADPVCVTVRTERDHSYCEDLLMAGSMEELPADAKTTTGFFFFNLKINVF